MICERQADSHGESDLNNSSMIERLSLFGGPIEGEENTEVDASSSKRVSMPRSEGESVHG